MALVGWRWGGVVKRGGTKGKGGRTKRAVGLARAAHLVQKKLFQQADDDNNHRIMLGHLKNSGRCSSPCTSPHGLYDGHGCRFVVAAELWGEEEEMIQKVAKEKAKLGKEKGCMKRIDRGCGRIPNQIY
jgi:hypothetical protein